MIHLGNYIYFSTDYSDMNFDLIYNFIHKSYWGLFRTKNEQKKAMENTINFGLFHENDQIAYARVMTDKVFFAYLLDVFVIETYRGLGYSKLLINKILNTPELNGVDKWMLATKDAHGLYEQFGFTQIENPEKLMEKLTPRAKTI